MSKPLPHVFTVTVPLIAGVKAYQTPLPKLGWHVGTGSPVAVAFAVLSVLVTPAESRIAPRHRSFTGVGSGMPSSRSAGWRVISPWRQRSGRWGWRVSRSWCRSFDRRRRGSRRLNRSRCRILGVCHRCHESGHEADSNQSAWGSERTRTHSLPGSGGRPLLHLWFCCQTPNCWLKASEFLLLPHETMDYAGFC